VQISLLVLLTWLIRQISKFCCCCNNWKLIDEKNDESHACYSHWKKLAGITEFQVRLLQSDAIDSHLWTYWNNRFRISKLKTDSATWWFWVIDSSQPADNMSLQLHASWSILNNWGQCTTKLNRCHEAESEKGMNQLSYQMFQLTVWIWFINVYNV
jgi:hypothetical protein